MLAVDAGYPGANLFVRLADEDEALTPDLYLDEGETDLEHLGSYIASVPGQGALKAVAPPADTDLQAHALIEAANEVFDVCVVACDSLHSSYACDWLYEAEWVVACSHSAHGRDALRTALEAEELLGAGTLLCTAAQAPAPPEAGPLYEPHIEGRRLYALGGGTGQRAMRELAGALVEGANAIINQEREAER